MLINLRSPQIFCGAHELQAQRHCIPRDCRVVATSILGGLHHEYRLQKIAASGIKTPECIFCGRHRIGLPLVPDVPRPFWSRFVSHVGHARWSLQPYGAVEGSCVNDNGSSESIDRQLAYLVFRPAVAWVIPLIMTIRVSVLGLYRGIGIRRREPRLRLRPSRSFSSLVYKAPTSPRPPRHNMGRRQ